MYKKIAVTNRNLCSDLTTQIEKLHNSNFDYIILREKDLSLEEYTALAASAIKISNKIILHTFTDAAEALKYHKIHLPFNAFVNIADKIKNYDITGVSAHTLDDTFKAQELGASYVTISPVFHTSCKPDVPPLGLNKLEYICSKLSIPVYALGGVTFENAQSCISHGAKGVCMMSQAMKF